MIIARIALRKILTTSRRKMGIETVFKKIDAFSKKMSKCIKGLFRSFRKNNYVDTDDQNTPYFKNVYKCGYKENLAIYKKLRSIYKNE